MNVSDGRLVSLSCDDVYLDDDPTPSYGPPKPPPSPEEAAPQPLMTLQQDDHGDHHGKKVWLFVSRIDCVCQ